MSDNYLHLKYNIPNIDIIKDELNHKLPNDIIELIWYHYISVHIYQLLDEGLTEIVKYKLRDIYNTYIIEKYDNNNFYSSSCITNTCIKYGYLDLLKWLHDRNLTEYTYSIDLAAKNKNYEMLEWLNKIDTKNNYVMMCSTSAMDDAAIDGDLKLVEWLYNNRNEGCTESAINYASKYGHFEIVKFLVDRNFNYSINALEFACEEGHLNILNYLYYRKLDKLNKKCIFNCIKNTHLHILEYIYLNEPILLSNYKKEIIEIIDNIKFSEKKIEIIDFFIKYL
jgi:hypothetical protein